MSQDLPVIEGVRWNNVYSYLIDKNQKAAVDEASDTILLRYSFKTMLDNEEMWYYEEGCYYQNAENMAKKILQEQENIKTKLSSNFVNEVIASLKRKTFIKMRRTWNSKI